MQAEIILYDDNGNNFSIDLTSTQLAIICKILGFKFYKDGTMSCFSDNSLENIIQMKGNPLHSQEKSIR